MTVADDEAGGVGDAERSLRGSVELADREGDVELERAFVLQRRAAIGVLQFRRKIRRCRQSPPRRAAVVGDHRRQGIVLVYLNRGGKMNGGGMRKSKNKRERRKNERARR